MNKDRMMRPVPLEAKFKILQEKNYPKNFKNRGFRKDGEPFPRPLPVRDFLPLLLV